MKVLITYDLNNPGQSYDAIYEKIKEQGNWCHALQNLWFVDTSNSLGQVRDNLQAIADNNDKIFVSEVTDNRWRSYNLGNAADWLKNH